MFRRSAPAVELEALAQSTVTDLVRHALDALLPEPLANVRAREKAQREEWEKRLRDAA